MRIKEYIDISSKKLNSKYWNVTHVLVEHTEKGAKVFVIAHLTTCWEVDERSDFPVFHGPEICVVLNDPKDEEKDNTQRYLLDEHAGELLYWMLCRSSVYEVTKEQIFQVLYGATGATFETKRPHIIGR